MPCARSKIRSHPKGDRHDPYDRTHFADHCPHRGHLDPDYAEAAELHRCHLPYLGRAYGAQRHLSFHPLIVAVMADKFAPTYALTTRPCTSYAGRYRWVISGNGKPIQTSAEAFGTRRKARANGLVALVQLIKTSRTSLEGPRPARASKSSNG